MIAGTIYGVVLNDASERGLLAQAFTAPPYRAPPVAPVLYIKPRNCVVVQGGATPVDAGLDRLTVAATVGLIFGRDASRVSGENALAHVAAAALAIDLSEPADSYYRPAVRQRCRDGFLPLGQPAPFTPALLAGEIVTRIEGAEAHRWSLSRLEREASRLIADVSAFMTLAAGDMLLLGLANDAPQAPVGARIEASAPGFAPVRATLQEAR